VISSEFHAGRHVRQDIIEPTDIEELLAVARENRDRRADVLNRVGGAHVTPVLGPPGVGPAQTPLGPYDWALLCRVDGRRDLTELARVCGFTVVEAAQVVADLAMTGLLAIPTPPPEDESLLAPVVTLHPQAEPEDPQWRFDGTDAGEPDPVAAPLPDLPPERPSELLAEFGALLRDDPAPVAPEVPEVPAAVDSGAATDLEAVPAAPEPSGARDTATATATAEPSTPAPALVLAEPDPAAPALALVEPPAEPALALVPTGPAPTLTLVDDSPPPALSVVSPAAPTQSDSQPDTTAFMRELSSLSDDPDKDEPIVTRLVVPLTEHRRKRRLWGR
jgi:hypothetical protein